MKLDELKRELDLPHDSLACQISEQIIDARIAAGVTQSELARRVNTKQSSIARLESGKYPPSLTFLEEVVKALGYQLNVDLLIPVKIGADSRTMDFVGREMIQYSSAASSGNVTKYD
ncbi:MAG: helix-turn-helix domain-containing protein [Candidatus Uhrbacteria bacterium]|nr:helix-turn-helix domain-containing protein [Candidatus Uhrbacteria bacterium]